MILVTRKRSTRIVLALLVSGGLSIAISSYAAYMYFGGQSDIIGQPLVDTEFPPHSISPIYMKPVTWLMMSSIVAWYCILELAKERYSPDGRLKNSRAPSVIFVMLVLIAIVSFYEVIFNFVLWGSLMARIEPGEPFNPDTLVNPYPSDGYKVNLTFATKVGVTIFGCSVYGIYVFNGLRRQHLS